MAAQAPLWHRYAAVIAMTGPRKKWGLLCMTSWRPSTHPAACSNACVNGGLSVMLMRVPPKHTAWRSGFSQRKTRFEKPSFNGPLTEMLRTCGVFDLVARRALFEGTRSADDARTGLVGRVDRRS